MFYFHGQKFLSYSTVCILWNFQVLVTLLTCSLTNILLARYLFVIGGGFSLSHTCNPTHSLPSQCCYNLSFNIRLEIKPAHRVYLFSERQPWTFIGRFKVIHINMSLTSRRAKATISKSKIIRCIYLAISPTDTVHRVILE